MTPIALLFLGIAVVIIWGGLVASTIALSRRAEIADYPPGGDEVEAADHGTSSA